MTSQPKHPKSLGNAVVCILCPLTIVGHMSAADLLYTGNFDSTFTGSPGSISSLEGSFAFIADDTILGTQQIVPLTQFEMTPSSIGANTFPLEDMSALVFYRLSGELRGFWVGFGQPASLGTGTDDFSVQWDLDDEPIAQVALTTESTEDVYFSATANVEFSSIVVPEPQVAILLLGGLFALCMRRVHVRK